MFRALILALLALPAAAQNNLWPTGWTPHQTVKFGGLNILQDSTEIDGDAQIAVNVLTDNTYLEKRPGNVFLSSANAGFPVAYVTDWVAASGTRYLIQQSSGNVYATNFSGNPVLIATVAANYNLMTAPAFSRLEFADGYRPLWYWDGNSTYTVTDNADGNGSSNMTAPTCTLIDFKDNRLWCANLPYGFNTPGNTENGGGSYTVLTSSAGGDGYWAVPSDAAQVDDAPNRFDFSPDDGDQIVCLAHTPWGEFIGKHNSSWMMKGNGNLSYQPLPISSKTGCVDQRSVQMVYGVLVFLSVDGVYGYAGSGEPQLLTRELDPLMVTVREALSIQGFWATQLEPDWASGTESTTTGNLPVLPWNYVSSPGEIFPSSSTMYDDNTNPGTQTCTTNFDPNTGAPYTCGVGFSSDTAVNGGLLVNIDTTSVPLSIGYAQLNVSSSGAQVWGSSFPAGNYTTIVSSWGTPNSDNVAQSAWFPNAIMGTTLNAPPLSNVGIVYSNAGFINSPPQPYGYWNYGAWSVSWVPTQNDTGPGAFQDYFTCSPNSNDGTPCFQFNFLANGLPGTAWSGYGLSVTQGVITLAGSTFNANVYKSVAGVQNVIISTTVYLPATSTFIGLSTFTVTRTAGGYFSLYFDNALIGGGSSAPDGPGTKYLLTTMEMPYGFYQPGGGVTEFFFNSLTNVSLNGYSPSGSILSRIYDTHQTVPLAGVLESSYTLPGSPGQTALAFYVRDSTSPHNDDWSAWQASSDSVLAALPERYWQYEALFNTSVASMTPELSSVLLPAITTGYYYSKVDFLGNNIQAFQQFGVSENNPGTYGYALRTATYAFAAGNTSIPWVPQAANAQISIATGAYAQFRLDSTVLTVNPDGASAAEPIDAVFVRWLVGANLPAASATLDRRYFLCVTVSTSATANDTCLLWQKNKKWVMWATTTTISAAGMYNYQMVTGDGGVSGKVWKILQPNVYTDDGAPINSQWVSEDFTDNLPFNNKNFYGVMVDAQPVQGSSMTASYQISKSSNYISTQFTVDDGQSLDPTLPVLGSQYGNINQWVPSTSGFDQGKYLRIKFSDNQPGDYWRVNSYLFFTADMPWTQP